VLTDKQAAEAKAEYEALPGTPPDAFNSRKATGDASRDEAAVREMADEMRPTGSALRSAFCSPRSWPNATTSA